MKIHFDGVNMTSSTGPNTFARRLARGFFESGHDVVDFGQQADVSLVFIEPSGKPLARKIVQRLDGIWFKPSEFNTKNVLIRNLYKLADGVVWQSSFDKQMTTKWFGERDGRVIRNGTTSPPVKNFTSDVLRQIRTTFDSVFVCSANWHPQKRLKDNIALFKHIQNTISPSSCLIVMGNNPDVMVADKSIFYSGSLPEVLFLEVFSMADWMIHLAWLDHCPNTVVECLSQSTPVICASSGGTQELLCGFGVVLKEENEYKFTLEDYDSPPSIDVTQLKELRKPTTPAPDVNISGVVTSYVKYFEELI